MSSRVLPILLCVMLLAGLVPALPAAQAAPAARPHEAAVRAETTAAAAAPSGFQDTRVASVAQPTALAWTPDGRMLVATKPGVLKVYAGTSSRGDALNISSRTCSNSERGMLGVAVDPSFTTTRHIFIYYTANVSGSCRNRVSRFTVSGDDVVSGSERVLVTADPAGAGNHNAGDLNFGKDGKLYVSIGDGGCDPYGGGCAGANDAARSRNTLFGKILRLNKDGSIPSDNPFVGSNSARCNVSGNTSATWCRETYAWGLRNPFRFAMDPNASATRFFINDVGQNRYEEIDLGVKGADYGWNCREGAHDNPDSGCSAPYARGPILEYGHGTGCASITGGAFVPNGVWPSGYNGSYLYADYVCGKIFRRSSSGAVSTFVSGLGGSSAVHLAFGPYGSSRALYYTNYNNGGEIRRIAYVGSANQAPTARFSASPRYGTLPLRVAFDGRGSTDLERGPLSYAWDFDGDGSVDSRNATGAFTYNRDTNYTAKLTVRDAAGKTDTAATTIYAGNEPPAPRITAPGASRLFYVNERIGLEGTYSDPDGDRVTLTWTVVRHHATHTHPFAGPTDGSSITITAPAPEDLAATTNSYLMLYLKATDSRGQYTTVRQRLNPYKVNVTLASQPTGFGLVVNGTRVTAPRTFVSWGSYTLNLSAPYYASHQFWKWSDGGRQNHAVRTPSSARTYTATYRIRTALTLSPSNQTVREGGTATLTGYLRTARGVLANRTAVYVYRSVDGGQTWSRDGTAAWDSNSQRYKARRTVTQPTRFYMAYAGNDAYAPSRSGSVSVNVE